MISLIARVSITMGRPARRSESDEDTFSRLGNVKLHIRLHEGINWTKCSCYRVQQSQTCFLYVKSRFGSVFGLAEKMVRPRFGYLETGCSIRAAETGLECITHTANRE
jgi:hypothetical protein